MSQESTHGQYVPEPEHVSVHTENTEGSSFTPPGDGGQQQNQPEPAGQPPAVPPPVVPPPVMPPLAIPPVAYEQMFPAMMAHYMQHMAQLMPMFQPPPPPQPQLRIVTFKTLKDNGAEEFRGDKLGEPQIALDWLDQMDWVLKNLRVPDADRSELASQMFRKGAYDWWKRIDQDPHTPKPWTWDRYDRAFTKEYVPTRYREERRDEFYGTSLVSTPEDRLNEFVKKLRPDLRPYAALITTTDFNAAYDLIVKTEKSLDDLQATKKEDRATKDPRPAASTGPSGKSFGFGGKRCPLSVQGKQFSADLIELPHKEFDIILGMDWLTEHRAVVGYSCRTVRLRAEDGSDVSLSGEVFPKTPEFISSLSARRLIHKKCEMFLCHVQDMRKESPRQQDIRMVCDFPDVFPEDLPAASRCLASPSLHLLAAPASCGLTVAGSTSPTARVGAAADGLQSPLFRLRRKPPLLAVKCSAAVSSFAGSPSPPLPSAAAASFASSRRHHRRRVQRRHAERWTSPPLPTSFLAVELQRRQSLLIAVELPLHHCRRRPSPSPHPAAASS
ncbi:unnamed protein product [Cuscuta campestris]|uniref:Retrotransposon gag domain-containing protein n=1 Tax=Cuscuta campestris TaxID=132261 RepID=A0A484M2V1_9ASTE|nr:unnamed protein product [Cuscuta campestris]